MGKGTSLTKKAPLFITWIAALAGIFDAAYLSYVKLTRVPVFCSPGFGNCESVSSSPYSYILGIPVAYLGLLTYLVIIFLLIFGGKIKFLQTNGIYALFGISFFGFLFSLYLTYLEIWVIKALCQWCLISAILMTVIFVCTSIRIFGRQVTTQS